MINEDSENRFAELAKRTKLSNAEMQEMIALHPENFVQLPNIRSLGVTDANLILAIQNLQELEKKKQKAIDLGCYIEAMNLKSAALEMFLKMVVVKHTGQPIPTDDQRNLGQYIQLADQAKFDHDIILRLRTFKKHRNDAIHGFLQGRLGYQMISEKYWEDKNLVQDVQAAVANFFRT